MMLHKCARLRLQQHGEFEYDCAEEGAPNVRCTDRELPLERTPNYYTGEPREIRTEK